MIPVVSSTLTHCVMVGTEIAARHMSNLNYNFKKILAALGGPVGLNAILQALATSVAQAKRRRAPDGPARALLKVAAANPRVVALALAG